MVQASCGHLFEDVLQRPALALDTVNCHLAFQEQRCETFVKARGILDPNNQRAIRWLKIETKEHARLKKMARQFLRSITLDGQLFRPILYVAPNFLLAPRSQNTTPIKDEYV